MVAIYLNCTKMTSRNSKTTPEQYEIMVQYIENHPNLKSNRLTNHFTAKDRSRLWEDLTECLNSIKGPQKDVQKWQKTWTDLKHITLKAARIKRRQLETSGSFNIESFTEDLSPLQLRVLNIIGWSEEIGQLAIEDGGYGKESPQSPTSPSDAFFPIIEEAYSENEEQMYESQEMDDIDDTESNIELFSITKYPGSEDYPRESKEESITINMLLQQQSKILEKISKQHKQILDIEESKREQNGTSVNVLLERQNKLLGKIALQLERLVDAEQIKKEEKSDSINVLLEQQNKLLEKIAQQQERIADAEHRKADILPELSNTIKGLLNK